MDKYPDKKSDTRGQALLKKARKAFSLEERTNVESIWSELAEFILPNQNSRFFGDTSKGIKRDTRVFDSTAIISNRDLASAMHSTITNPVMKWSKLKFKEEALNDDDDGSKWLAEATDAIHNMLNDSNFDSQIGQCYQSISAMGTLVLLHEEAQEDKDKLANFTAWHLAELAYTENHLGYVDTIYRRFKMTRQQAYDKFGDMIGKDQIDQLEADPFMDLDFFHCIYPRKKSEVRIDKDTGLADGLHRPFASCYVMEQGAIMVQEGGFYEFPVYCARWSKLPGEIYGVGPGHVARPDVRTLNKLREETLKAMAKAVNPPIITAKNNIVSADFRPGKLTVVSDTEKLREFITQTRFDVVKLEVEDLKGSIKSAFYIDKLLLPPRTETGEMTAYEIAQRLEQMQTILGPVLSRLNAEFLSPFIMRCLKILYRAKKIRPLPQSVLSKMQTATMKGKGSAEIDFEITFVNSLARSQQMSELRNIQTYLQELAGLVQLQATAGMQPDILDKINFDKIVDYTSKIRNIPPDMIRSDKDVQEGRDQKAKEAQMQKMLAMGDQAGNIVKNVAPAMNPKGTK